MVNDFDSKTTGRGALERTRPIPGERCPGLLVNLGLQTGFKLFVGIIGSQKISIMDKEDFFIIIRVDELGSNIILARSSHAAGFRIEHVNA